MVHTVSIYSGDERENVQQMDEQNRFNRFLKATILCFFFEATHLSDMITTIPYGVKHKKLALDTKILAQQPTWESFRIWPFCGISQV